MNTPKKGPLFGIMSDLHLEREDMYWDRVWRRAARGRSAEIQAALDLRNALAKEEDHPHIGPDLRELKARGVDALILAGDVDHGIRAVDYARDARDYLGCPVLLTSGNHEHYGADFDRTLAAMSQAARAADGIHFLERESVHLTLGSSKVAFLGATLWTDYRLYGDPGRAAAVAERDLNDHVLIGLGNRDFMPADALKEHEQAIAWLSREVPAARVEADYVVVITHHAPIAEANGPHYQGSSLSPAFVSDLAHRILEWSPDLWVFGHTHYSMMAELGRTRLVSAQRGYLMAEKGAESFVPAIVELSPVDPPSG